VFRQPKVDGGQIFLTAKTIIVLETMEKEADGFLRKSTQFSRKLNEFSRKLKTSEYLFLQD
jgi:hypothetical protein